jgi:hypothetical protein
MRLAQVLRELATHLEQLGLEFAVVGGIAASARGEPRFTRDVDVAVAVSGDEQAEAVLFQLGRLGYVVRATVEHDVAKRLATASRRRSATRCHEWSTPLAAQPAKGWRARAESLRLRRPLACEGRVPS